MSKQTFTEWLERVDNIVERRTGASINDLPDVCFHDMYDDGITAGAAASAVIRCAKEEGY